jgi:hypothetical protein
MKLKIWEMCDMVFMIGRLIWKCVIPWMIMGDVLLRGLDLIMTINKEVKKKLRQDMRRKKTRKFWKEIKSIKKNK